MNTQKRKPTYEFPDHGEAKLRELILHIATQYAGAPRFGATKLNKILFFSDFYWYKHHGEPITGVEYMHLDKGPAPRRMVPIRNQMIDNNEIIVIKNEFPNGKAQQRIVAQQKANLDQFFTSEQIAFVDRLISMFWDADAEATSDVSHGIAWKVFDSDKESIPYEAALLSEDTITADDVERTGELAIQYGW